MSDERALPALLLERAGRSPDRVFARVSRGGEETAVAYGELAARASRFARALESAGVGAGDVVPLAAPTSAEYLYALFGAYLLGAAVAPLPPLTVFKEERARFHAARLATAARCCGSPVAVVAAEAAPRLAASGERALPELLEIEALAAETGEGPAPSPAGPDGVALVQFSSGSTAEPKGVRIRFRNIAVNGAAIARRSGVTPDDSMLSFLPLFHDFGFFTGIVLPLLWDVPTWLFETAEFVRRPSFWPKAMSRTRATLCPAPQFVYDVAISRIRDRDLEGVDLSAWRVCYNGGEPIRAETLRRFNDRFAPWGLAPTVVLPSYGMAEATLAIAIHPTGTPFEAHRVSRDALVDEGVARDALPGEPALEIVSCGPPLDDVEVAVLDEAGAGRPDGEVGEIALSGPSLADEYVVGPGETRALARDGWFRTGDVGYVAGGRVHVTGRVKELIIRGGRNYYPQDVERVVESLDGARLGGVVAFGCLEPGGAGERVVAVVERDTADEELLRSLPERARHAVFGALGLMLDDVAVRRRGWVPKTTSAKLQRARARELYLASLEQEEEGRG